MDNDAGGLATTTTQDSAAANTGSPTVQPSVQPTGATGTALPSNGTVTPTASPNTATSTATGGDAGGGSFLSNIGNLFTSGNLGSLAKGIAPVLAGGGIINSIVGGTGKIPQSGMLKNVAGQTYGAGQQEVQAAQAGQLPPGMEQQFDQQLAAQIAAIQANYAAKGLSGSSMEQQDIAAAQNQIQAQKQQELQTYLQQGLNTLGTAGSDYAAIGELQMKQNQDMATQIQNFLKAMGGGSSGGQSGNITFGS